MKDEKPTPVGTKKYPSPLFFGFRYQIPLYGILHLLYGQCSNLFIAAAAVAAQASSLKAEGMNFLQKKNYLFLKWKMLEKKLARLMER